MKNNNTETIKQELARKISDAVAAIEQAAEKDDRDALIGGLRDLVSADVEQKAQEIAQRLAREQEEASELADEQVLAQRGVRQLTSKEKEFYQKFAECAKAKDPQQALTNANLVLPESIVDRVFEDLRTEHPLLSKITFLPTGAAIKMILNKNGYQKAAWGELCDEIVKELTSGFEVVNTNLFKLSAFLPVCKQALILGPAWMDRYVREVLYEALANGLEDGIINGTGKDMPIGMIRQVGEGVTVTDGVYPVKDAVAIADLGPKTLGALLGSVSVSPTGVGRAVRNVVMIVNPFDRYTKVDPALLYLRPDGTYARALPYPMEIIESPAVTQGEAVFGLAYRYAAFAGSPTDGNIDYSDHYKFLEDQRVYLVKGFANGFALDNNAFLRLDISALQTFLPEVAIVNKRDPLAPTILVSSNISDDVDLLGKVASDLQSGVSVGAAAVNGTLKYVTGYTGFSGDVSEQSGNYLALHVMADDGATIKLDLVGGTTGEKTLDADGLAILRITSTDEKIKLTATKNGRSTVKTLALNGLTLETF